MSGQTALAEVDDDCSSCGEDVKPHECPNSKRECGHHCNCSWSQDECCWCGETFDCPDDPADLHIVEMYTDLGGGG